MLPAGIRPQTLRVGLEQRHGPVLHTDTDDVSERTVGQRACGARQDPQINLLVGADVPDTNRPARVLRTCTSKDQHTIYGASRQQTAENKTTTGDDMLLSTMSMQKKVVSIRKGYDSKMDGSTCHRRTSRTRLYWDGSLKKKPRGNASRQITAALTIGYWMTMMTMLR